MSETSHKVADLSDISEVMLSVSQLQVVDIIDGTTGMNAEVLQIELLDDNRESPLMDENHNRCNPELEDITLSIAVQEECNRVTEQDKQEEEEKDKKKEEEKKETEQTVAVENTTPETRNEITEEINLDLQEGHEEKEKAVSKETKVTRKENGQEEEESEAETLEAQQDLKSDSASSKCLEKGEKEHDMQEGEKEDESSETEISHHEVQICEMQEKSNEEGELEEDEEEICPEEYQDKNDSQEFPSGSPDSSTDTELPAISKEHSGAGRKPDIIRQIFPNRYNTVSYRKIRKGNTKQRIDEFESMMHA